MICSLSGENSTAGTAIVVGNASGGVGYAFTFHNIFGCGPSACSAEAPQTTQPYTKSATRAGNAHEEKHPRFIKASMPEQPLLDQLPCPVKPALFAALPSLPYVEYSVHESRALPSGFHLFTNPSLCVPPA